MAETNGGRRHPAPRQTRPMLDQDWSASGAPRTDANLPMPQPRTAEPPSWVPGSARRAGQVQGQQAGFGQAPGTAPGGQHPSFQPRPAAAQQPAPQQPAAQQHPSFQPRPAAPRPTAPTGQHPSFQPRPAAASQQHPSFQPRPAAPQPTAPTGRHPSFQPRPAAGGQHPSFQPRPSAGPQQPTGAPAAQHPSFQPRPSAAPQQPTGALPQRQSAAPSAQRAEGLTRDLRTPAPARRREPEWLRPAPERRIPGAEERSTEVTRLSDRATGRDLIQRPPNDTALMPATTSGSGYGGGYGGYGSGGGDDDDLRPFDRGGSGGRHRGPRRPSFRAAVPIAAVLAAGGGALGLVHAVSSGAPGSAVDMASGNNGTITTDLSNAPSAYDGSTSGSNQGASTDPATSPLDATTDGGGTHSTSNPGRQTTAAPPGTHSTAPGTTTPTSAPSGPGTPASSAPGLPSNTPLPPTSPAPSTPVTSPVSTTPDTPAPPTSTTTPPGTPAPPTSTTPGTPSSPGPTTPTSTNPTPTSPPPSTPSAPGSSSPSTPQISPSAGTLQAGDTGPNVSILQTLLDRLGTPTWVPVTGVYDTRTTEAVAYVQNMLNITADPRGVCGPTTAAAINTLAAHSG